ncbi:MAG: thioredoxin family protein [Burkholderiaceae bacterium]|nr:MAG: thioredoxin family protein [Burkholderiaceae bacterium]
MLAKTTLFIALLLTGAAFHTSQALAQSAAPAAPNAPVVAAYDERADAEKDIAAAQARAKAAGKPVLLIFGANWCGDCLALDKALKVPANAELVKSRFEVVKVDVGRFDRHLEIAARLGNPIKKGIPAAVVLTADGKAAYATHGGELANARKMSETGVGEFFKDLAARHPR